MVMRDDCVRRSNSAPFVVEAEKPMPKIKPALVLGSGFHRFVLGDTTSYRHRTPLVSWSALLDQVAEQLEVPVPAQSLTSPMRWEEILLSRSRHDQKTPPSKAEQDARKAVATIMSGAAKDYPDNERSRIPKDPVWGAVVSLNFDMAWMQAAEAIELTVLSLQGDDYLSRIKPPIERSRLSMSVPVMTDEEAVSSRVWFPNGAYFRPATLRMGLRDYGFKAAALDKAFGIIKGWERRGTQRHDSPSEKFEAVCRLLESKETIDQSPPLTWVTHFLYRPLVFLGVGLSPDEQGLWWLLSQRARNTRLVNRTDRAKAHILLRSDDERRSMWEQRPFGLEPYFCTSWQYGWEEMMEKVETETEHD